MVSNLPAMQIRAIHRKRVRGASGSLRAAAALLAAFAAPLCPVPVKAKAKPACSMEVLAALPLGFASALATVETKIDGHPALLGIDTGAKTLLTPDAVFAFHLRRDWRRTRAVGTTAVIVANNYLIADLEFADHHYRDKSVAKLALPEDKKGGAEVMGLLGSDVLSNFDLDFDFPKRKLTVYKVSGCKTVSPPDFTVANTIPFKFNAQRGVAFTADLDGKKLTALIDTGATANFITRTAARRLKVTAATVNTDLAGKTTGVGNVTAKDLYNQFQSLSLGNETLAGPLLGIVNTPIAGGDILVGQTFLFSRRFFISNATHTLLLEKAPGPVFKFTPSTVTKLAPPYIQNCTSNSELDPTGKCGAPPNAARLDPPTVPADSGNCTAYPVFGPKGNCGGTVP